MTIFDEANAIMHQMSSDTNARESENAMCDVLSFTKHILAMDVFTNKLTLTFFQVYHNVNV